MGYDIWVTPREQQTFIGLEDRALSKHIWLVENATQATIDLLIAAYETCVLLGASDPGPLGDMLAQCFAGYYVERRRQESGYVAIWRALKSVQRSNFRFSKGGNRYNYINAYTKHTRSETADGSPHSATEDQILIKIREQLAELEIPCDDDMVSAEFLKKCVEWGWIDLMEPFYNIDLYKGALKWVIVNGRTEIQDWSLRREEFDATLMHPDDCMSNPFGPTLLPSGYALNKLEFRDDEVGWPGQEELEPGIDLNLDEEPDRPVDTIGPFDEHGRER